MPNYKITVESSAGGVMSVNHTAERNVYVKSGINTVAAERDGLNLLIKAFEGGLGINFAAAVERIAQADGRVICTGMGKSGHIARKIAATLASTGCSSLYVHPAEASHGDLGMIQPNDVVLAFSWSGETTELADVIRHSKRFRVALVAVTSNPDSTLGKMSDVCLMLPSATEACPNGLAPTTSTTMQLAMGDSIAVALLQSRGFSASEFSIFHPGGKLGASLRRVEEVMHCGQNLPQVVSGTTMRAAVAEMDAKALGCVVVVNSTGGLEGIITDGDLRRHMFETNLAEIPVERVMSLSPCVVSPDTLLAKALAIQESRRITALVVVEDKSPVGIVHYQDLLKSGVI